MDPQKAGWRTSEFWLSLLAMILPPVIALLTKFENPVVEVVVTILAAVVSVLAAMGYTGSRAVVKREAIRANGHR